MRGKLLLVAGIATAIATSGVASAHTFTADTDLTMRRRPRVIEKGQVVRFFGRLKSARPKCRRFKRINLIRKRDGAVVGSDRTNRRGRYSILKRVYRTNRFYTRFNGTVRGVHPHRHTCLASRSRSRRVIVR